MRVVEVRSGFRKGTRYRECPLDFQAHADMWREYQADPSKGQPIPEGHIWFDRPGEFGLKKISGYVGAP